MRYDKDFRELAELNHLDSQYTIHPGLRLRLRGRPGYSFHTPPPKVASPSHTAQLPRSRSATSVAKKAHPVTASSDEVRPSSPPASSLPWGWPARGSLIGTFGSTGVTGRGLDIAGKRGDSVLAAASGTVVYAGSSLVGYGRLLIIRHDENYISAYAHNDKFLVKEGDSVKLGQAIAEMGASGTDREELHFEIRERGKPVDPLRFLPAREQAGP